MESFSVIFSIRGLWAAESRSLCCLCPVMTCSHLCVALLAWSASVSFSSSFFHVRILFWVFCWFVLLRGPQAGVFSFLPAEIQELEHRRGVSSKWTRWQHTLWWVSSPNLGTGRLGSSFSVSNAIHSPVTSKLGDDPELENTDRLLLVYF